MFNLIPPQYQLAIKVAVTATIFLLGYWGGYSHVSKQWELERAQQQAESGKVLAAAVNRANLVAEDLRSFAYSSEVKARENDKKLSSLELANAKLLANSRLRVNSTPSYKQSLPKDSQGIADGACKVAGSWILSAKDTEDIVGTARQADELVEELRNCQGRLTRIITIMQ